MSRSSASSPSREYSPDWLRNHQAQGPKTTIWTLTSSSSSDSDKEDDDRLPISSILTNTNTDTLPLQSADNAQHSPSPSPQTKRNKTITKQQQQQQAGADTTTNEKQTGPYISSSTLPLLLADKVQRSKVLVECEGESIDLSGDLGSVGRVVISDSPSANQDMLLDLKGTIYKTTIMPSRTFCVVSFGQSEAKIEAIMNDFIQLKPQSNVYEAETMVEGTLEGFSFDSEDEGDKHAIRQNDENEGGEPQTNGKSRGRSEAVKKKGKTAVKKPPASAKKVNKKKGPVGKKTKAKK